MDSLLTLSGLGGGLYTALLFILALSVIVAVHEYGHYLIGRLSGIHAEVFSIGFGPVLWSRYDRRGTRWQIAAVPLGGFVKFLGDANASSAGADEATMAELSPEQRRHTMHGAPLWARAATVFAGPMFNFLFSILIFGASVLFTGVATETPGVSSLRALPQAHGLQEGDLILAVDGRETPDFAALRQVADTLPADGTFDYRVERDGQALTVTGPNPMPAIIHSVLPKSAAGDAGLQAGDVILAVDGRPTPRFDDLRTAVTQSGGKSLQLTVWRDGQEFQTVLTPRERPVQDEEGGFETAYQIGIASGFVFDPLTRRATLWEALSTGVAATWGVIDQTFRALSSMIAGQISTCNVNGMIGMAQAAGAAADQGATNFIWLVAALSTAIGLVNLFPVPVLDGGHLVFHAYEWARGKPPSDRFMNTAMAFGLALVLMLMLFGLSNDLFCA